ncbi:MAG: hypothetical protein HC888_17225 [Candidatus Competibacteraceae bacterium]|nr:hypothetical protein [Candidatus Competibacteraceae bacterium]
MYASSYGGSDKYVDVRVFFKELAKPGESFKSQRHASYRIQETGPLAGALSYSHEYKNLTDDERASRLRHGLIDTRFPMLNSFATIEGLRGVLVGQL